MGRQDRLNWQIRLAAREMTAGQLLQFETLFGHKARADYDDDSWPSSLAPRCEE